MAIVVRHDTDAGAPVLNGLAGSLIAVLDFALVTGAGWEKVFTGTNTAVYRAPAGRRFYLRVDDSTGVSASCSNYETMTDVDTGTAPTPAVYFSKSATADATARLWSVFASARGFCLWTSPSTYPCIYYYGDIRTAIPNDAYAVFIFGANSATTTSYSNLINGTQLTGFAMQATNGHYLARAASGVGSPIPAGKRGANFANNAEFGMSGWSYPNPADGSITMSQVMVLSNADGVRGYVPGLWTIEHNVSAVFAERGDTFSGSGDLAGRTFAAMRVTGTGASSGRMAIETTDWDY